MFQLLFREGNPCGIKALMNIQGTIENILRLPLYKISDELYNEIKQRHELIMR
jgi:4-hydroxy-tetrahydrodipicolinate synthase